MMGVNLFVYGTLRHPGIWAAVVPNPYASLPAFLQGYVALRVRDADYPGLVEREGNSVEGLVYLDVSGDDLRRLDRFEGNQIRGYAE